MRGRSNGRQDYVWIWSNGKMHIYEALDNFSDSPPYWGSDYVMFDLTGSRAMDRRDLHLADWDGDGACDSKCLPRDLGIYSEPARACLCRDSPAEDSDALHFPH